MSLRAGSNEIAQDQIPVVKTNFIEKTSKDLFTSWIEVNFIKDPAYSYKLGMKITESDNQEIMKVSASRLYKNGKLVDELIHKNLNNFGDIFLDTLYRYVPMEGLNELGVLNNEASFCGGGQGKILFGRSGDKLLKEICIQNEYDGEGVYPGTFTMMDFSLDLRRQELIISTQKGFDFADANKKEKTYYDLQERHKFRDNKFIKTRIKAPKFMFVNAENGLSVRRDPFLTSPRETVLRHGQRVKVIQTTDLTMSVKEGKDIIDGHWVEIENSKDYRLPSLYVFNGYLSDQKPPLKKK